MHNFLTSVFHILYCLKCTNWFCSQNSSSTPLLQSLWPSQTKSRLMNLLSLQLKNNSSSKIGFGNSNWINGRFCLSFTLLALTSLEMVRNKIIRGIFMMRSTFSKANRRLRIFGNKFGAFRYRKSRLSTLSWYSVAI